MRPRKAKEPQIEVAMKVVPSPDADRRLRQAIDLILRAAQRAKEGQAETENEPSSEGVTEGTDG